MPSNDITIIALDGGAASGKSSTARELAKRFHLLHVDTGTHFRALTHYFLSSNILPEDTQTIESSLKSLVLSTEVEGNIAHILLDKQRTPTSDLRSEPVNSNISYYSAIPTLRSFLKDYQRSLVQVAIDNNFQGLAIEGRDIGSVIFPDAHYRFFLEADPETRAKRRAGQGEADSILKRDKLDSSRKVAPLTCPEGAQKIDSSNMPLEAVVETVAQIVAPAFS